MMEDLEIRQINEWNHEDMHAMCALLTAVVEGGASIGFLPPLSRNTCEDYWLSVLDTSTRLWVARYHGEIVGTVQLQLSTKQNGLHRAEIAKLMVHPKARRLGIAHSLMQVAESWAIQEKRSLIVLDTRAGDPSNDLYRSLNYIEVGRIPQYAKSMNGELDATVIYYKLL